MITKAAFFEILNDPENKIGVTAHIAFVAHDNGTHELIIKQNGAPNTWLSNHKMYTTTTAAFHKYNDWINEWFTAQAEAAQARIDLLAQIEADKAEGDNLAAEIQQDIDVAIAHAEALQVNELVDLAVQQATFFADNDRATPNAIRNAIDSIRSNLVGLNRYNANFIVKMMMAVSSLAKEARTNAKLRYLMMLERRNDEPDSIYQLPF